MRFVAIALVLSLLAAPIAAKEKPQDPAALAATHGFVYAGFSKGQGLVLAVQAQQGGKPILVTTQVESDTLPGAQALGMWLPAGQYRVIGWNARDRNKWTDGPSFEIQAGRITSLGNFVPVNIGGYDIVLLPADHAENNTGLAAQTQRLASYLKDPTALVARTTLIPPPVPQALAGPVNTGLAYDILKSATDSANKPPSLQQLKAERDPTRFLRLWRSITPPLGEQAAVTADGSIYAGADMGQVRKRSAEGVWTTLSIDTLRPITAVAHADGRLLAGSDNGHLRVSSDDGAHWSELHRFGPLESIVDLDHSAGTWIITTSEKYKDPAFKRSGWVYSAPDGLSAKLRVYVAHSNDLSDLTLSKEVAMSPVDRALVLAGQRGTVVNGNFYINITPRLHRLSLATGEWKDMSVAHKVGTLHVDPDSEVITVLGDMGVSAKLSMSTDRGASWLPMERPAYTVYDAQMDSPTQGWLLRYNHAVFTGVYEQYAYIPAAKDWVLMNTAPHQCKPWRLSKTLPVICVAADARILSLQGKQWKVEFDTQAAGK